MIRCLLHHNISIQNPLFTLAMVGPSIFTSILNASNVFAIDCFRPSRPGLPQLQPLTYVTCEKAIHKIHLNEKALAPITFSQNPNAGFMVPHSWSHGNCVIIIDVVEPNAEETATFAAVFKRGFDLAIECVINPPHLGGRSKLGTSQMLDIMMVESNARKSP